MKDLIFNETDHTYTYVPTGEVIPAECLDEFANRKLEEAIARLAKAATIVLNQPTSGKPPG